MCHGRHDQPVHIGKNPIHRFPVQWRRNGKRANEIARTNAWEHGSLFDILQIVCHPIYELMAVPTKFIFWHVTKRDMARSWVNYLIHWRPFYL